MNIPTSTKEVPFFKLIIPLLAGISCQYFLNIFNSSLWYYLIALLLLSLLFFGYNLSSRWQFRPVFGIILNLSLFFFGAMLTVTQPLSKNIDVNANNRVILRLLDNPQVRIKSIRVEAEVSSAFSSGIWWSTNEKMLVYFDLSDTLANELCYGSLLAVELKPQEVSQQGNPEQFNFKRYLSNRGIRLTAHILKDNWIIIGYKGFFLKRIALKLRDRLVTLFKESGLSDDNLAVASALTLGYQDLLDDELRQVYSSSGAMHILSVSGLHVGILYVLLSFLLSFLNKSIVERTIKALILICFLWFFALLTGLPPCVQRSALMFSFLVFGDLFSRKSNIYNTLAASAFVLLAINPYNLFDIGFQLSYLAILSIVFFYPFVYKIIYVKRWALDKVWSLIAVSIAAQIGTFSISLFYFNQFPNYFLLSNLIAIPLSTIALYLAVLLIIVSPIHFLSLYVGKALSLTVSLLNHGLELVENLPYSVSEGLNISSSQMIILFIIALCIAFLLVTKRGVYALIGLSLFVIYFSLNLFSNIEKSRLKEFVVFNIGKKSLVSYSLGEKLVFIDVDTTKREFNKKYDFFIKNYISKVSNSSSVEVFNPFFVEPKSNSKFWNVTTLNGISFVSINNELIAIPFEKELDNYLISKKMHIDYLVINQFCSSKILNFFKPKIVIVDSSVSKHKTSEIISKCRQSGIPFYLVATQGAYIKTI